MKATLFVWCLFFFLLAVSVNSYGGGDRITQLPGLFPMPSFRMYSGYITVDESHGRALFYWFAESQNNPSTDPLILWLQGGPGCSSLYGFFAENGPFVPDQSGSLKENFYSWNKFANMLYIESPVGVGFSYSNTSEDYNTNNTQTAKDNYVFLKRWFARFPQYRDNPFFVAGESYGGDYVPQLVALIVNGQIKNQSSAIQNLVGFCVGNPVMSCPMWDKNQDTYEISLYFWHALIPLSTYQEWLQSGCGGIYSADTNPGLSQYCQELYRSIKDYVGPFNPDNLYSNSLTGNASLGVGDISSQKININSLMQRYLRWKVVQQAIHARPTKWVGCCAEVGQGGQPCQLNYTNHWTNLLPTYEMFFERAPWLRILIYSGDVDIDTCPHAYTQICLAGLNRTLVQPWTPWVIFDQTAGYFEVYDRYTYATVKGAGHEVPFYQPHQAYVMMESFVNNQTFPVRSLFDEHVKLKRYAKAPYGLSMYYVDPEEADLDIYD